jgi:hypothetical protein
MGGIADNVGVGGSRLSIVDRIVIGTAQDGGPPGLARQRYGRRFQGKRDGGQEEQPDFQITREPPFTIHNSQHKTPNNHAHAAITDILYR